MPGQKKIFWFLFLIIVNVSAYCQQYNFGHIDYTNGLSNNHIMSITEDDNGFLWIGTASGLNRYDGYNIKVFKHNHQDSITIPDNMIQSMVKDQLGRIWMEMPGITTIFNPNTEEFSTDFRINVKENNFNLYNLDLVLPMGDSLIAFRITGYGILIHNIFTNKNAILQNNPIDNESLSSVNISFIAYSGHSLYIIHRNGIIDVVNISTEKVQKKISILFDKNKIECDYELFIDNKKNIWIFSNDVAQGLFRIDNSDNLKVFNINSQPSLNSNIVSVILQDAENNFWIGTDHGGLNILSNDLNSITYITHEKANEKSLSQDVITELFKSSNNIIWIGTFKKGINIYHKKRISFNLYKNQPEIDYSLPYNDVNCFAEDKKGNLWIGTNGNGLVYFDRNKNHFVNILSENYIPGKIKSNVIVSLLVDRKNQLWIGTYHGGLSLYDGNHITTYLNDPKNPKTLSDNKVWDIFEDSHNNIWIGTLGGGVDLFNQELNIFQHFSGSGMNAINSNFVMDIAEDKNQNIWFGTDNGVFIYDLTKSRFLHFIHDKEDKSSLSNDLVYIIFKDSKGNMWAGTRDGLNLYNETNNSFRKFTTENGLADNSIMSILESDEGNMWLGTTNGISKLVINYDSDGKYVKHHTINYNESDGLQGREFNEGSAFKTKNGELIFGGSNGFNLFIPDVDDTTREKYSTFITGLEIYGEEIKINNYEKSRNIISSSVLNGKTIELNSQEDIFALKFVTINFLASKKISYRYKLEGFNDQWIYSVWQDRKATYTNLNPGKYIFKVQASDHISDWEESESTLNIIIRPPWYTTWLAYVIYFVIAVLIVIVFRNMLITKERNKFIKEQAILESEKQHELNKLKTRFFTNVSHEFRTPLTLIITPLEKLLKSNLNKETAKHLELMFQNTKRLSNLVNQLLDFRRVEENKLKSNFIYGNIIGFLTQTINSFTDFSESKQIELEFLPDETELFMQFDRDKIEKIMLNLLSNAFKFTKEKGHIKVYTEVLLIEGNERFIITVEDNGIGIKKEYQEKIFDRFYQTNLPKQFIKKGSGIGLSLTKEFVELHNGKIKLDSIIGVGSKFIVDLPLNRNPSDEIEEGIESDLLKEEIIKIDNQPNDLNKNNKKTILLVDDNKEFRFYLRDSLQEKYKILEAENGRYALKLLESKQPDLIVSDILMPEVDGLKLCEEIKTNPSFSHIPIILLTAKSTQQDKIDGLKQGADDYITKPFNLEILESRIKYLLGLREKFIRHYQKSFKVEAESNSITPLDQKLLRKALDLIQKNLSNTEFSVEKLSSELGMSRVYLYKKLNSLTGKTPIELIRLVRLKKAADLLLSSQLTISEITYEVGFSDPRYFSKLFKNEFKILPSKYKENQGL